MTNLKQQKTYKILKRIFFSLVYLFYKTTGQKNQKYYLAKWFIENPDNNFLIKYPLEKSSLVVDVGGYIGNFSDNLISTFNPKLIIFEPVKKYFRALKTKYSNNRRVILYNYGLSDKNITQNIYMSKDSSSLFKRSNTKAKIKLIDVANFLKKFNYIDLMSINIEGAEYEVLNRIIEKGLINKIKFLQVQFHNFTPKSKESRKNIIKKILKTHKKRFSYPFVWEAFERRN